MDQPQNVIDPDSVDHLEITGFLNEVLHHTRQRVAQRQQEVPIAGLRALNTIQKRPLDLTSALRHRDGVSLVVEIKRQSHNGKLLVEGRYEPDEIARFFAKLGVQAVSVATDNRYYGGELHHLTYVSRATTIPVIRQDFVFDRYQVYEARAAGADGVILIAALLGAYRLWDLISFTQRLSMTAVVQVETEEELNRTLQADPRVIGISNVDWRTLDVDLSKTTKLTKKIPDHISVISMGGVRTPDDVALVADAGVDAILAGEAILSAPNSAEAIQHLFQFLDSNPTQTHQIPE